MDAFKAFEPIDEFMKTSPDYHVQGLNWDLLTFDGPQYSLYGAFDSDVNAKLVEIIAGTGDVDAEWDAFLAEMQPKWQPIADELNSTFKK